MNNPVRLALGAVALVGAVLTASTALSWPLHSDHASAATSATGNPWNWTMTVPNKDGMSIKGMPNSLNQIFTVKDPYGAPIVSVGHVGGLSVFGDQIRVFAPNTLDNPVAVIGFDGRISLQGPNAGVYVEGELLTKEDIAWVHSHE